MFGHLVRADSQLTMTLPHQARPHNVDWIPGCRSQLTWETCCRADKCCKVHAIGPFYRTSADDPQQPIYAMPCINQVWSCLLWES